MSETHGHSAQEDRGSKDDDSSSFSNCSSTMDNNSRVNSKPTELNNNDELNEEFDFSDSDFKECNESADSDDNSSEREAKKDKANAVVDSTIAGAAHDNNVAHSDNNDTKGSTTTTIPVALKDTDADKSEHNCSQVAVCEEVNAVVAADNISSTVADKRNIAVPRLELQDEDSTTKASEMLAEQFCPITPRKIVDVGTDSLLNVSNGGVVDKVQSATTGKAADGGDDVGGGDFDDAADAADSVDPDDELISQFLEGANCIAEARLAARRQARAEAREIRMRELERQQKEQEQNADRVFDMHTASGIDTLSRSRLATGISSSPVGAVLNSTRGSSMSSRRSSEDSLEEEGRSLRDIRHELKDVEERFRKAMIANAQLDNERASQTYQIQLLKDKLEEMEESYAQLQREFKEKSRDCNALKRNLDKLSEELKLVQGQLSERDALIAEQGLVIVAVENEDGTDAKRALVSVENAQLLGSVQGSLDVRLKKFSEEKQQLSAEVQKLQEQLENYKSQGRGRGNSMNGPLGSDDDYEAQREANKIISDYKYKLQKAEQEIASLQASLARSETQVIRYKSTAEAAEKAEAELKIERRKLQRENREAMERLEELETSNNHLLKRLDKLKNAKSALLKDL